VRLAKLRWRVERHHQEFKEEIGLDHLEGRTRRGFHHHVIYTRPLTRFSSSPERFRPRSAKRWTLSLVRRHLQLVRRIGSCPLCRQPVCPSTLPRGPSKRVVLEGGAQHREERLRRVLGGGDRLHGLDEVLLGELPGGEVLG